MTQAPAGWYPLPDGTQRYWDGSAWTEHTAPGTGVATPPATAEPPVIAEPPVVAEPEVIAAPPMAAEPEVIAAPPMAAAPPAPQGPPTLAAPPAPPAQQAAYAAMPSAAPVVKPRKRVWPWVLGIGGGLLVVIIVLVVWGISTFVGAVKGPGDAVTALDQAWRNGDCAAMQKLTTAEVRTSSGWEDCTVFEAATPTSLDGLSLHVTSTSIVNGVATVVTSEEWADGAGPHTGTYTVIKVDGDWTVSAATFE